MYLHRRLPVPWRVVTRSERAALELRAWRRPRAEISIAPGAPVARLVALGDVCLADAAERRARDVFGDLMPVLDAADVVTANLEGVVTTREQPAIRIGSAVRAAPAALRVLAEARLRVVGVANNHALDYGSPGLDEAISSLRSHGIETCGAATGTAPQQAAILSARSLRIAFLAFCDDHAAVVSGSDAVRPSTYAPEHAAAAVKSLRDSVDLLIVHLHWGYEFALHPLLWHRDQARRLVDEGADAVLCHHAHVPQGVEIWRGRPIAYGLGNAVMPMSPYMRAGHPWTDRSFALELELIHKGIGRVRIHPFRLSSGGCLRSLGGWARRGLLGALECMSARLLDTDFLTRVERSCLLHEATRLVHALRSDAVDGDERLRERATTLTLPRQQRLIGYLAGFRELADLSKILAHAGELAAYPQQARNLLRDAAADIDEAVERAAALYDWRATLRSRVP